MKLNEKKINDFFKIINEKKIKSVFQPIVSLKTGEIVSFEALSRITLESCPINIEELFKIANTLEQSWKLDQLCRKCAIKASQQMPSGKKLFINVDANILLDSDFVQGFTKEYLKSIHFYEMHIFQYSKREGTKAAVMEHQVPEPVKKERSNILLALEKKMSEEFREYYVGKQVTALMEEAYEFEGETYFTGYTKEYVKIAVKSAADLSNQFVKGTIRGRLTDDIYLMVEF